MTGRVPEIVAVGSIGLDDVETPVARREGLLGGSMSYACPAASFYGRVGMVGVVGTDFPAACMENYRAFGIDLEGVRTLPGRTFRWSGVYEADFINRRTLRTELNVFEAFDPELPAAYREAPLLLLGNISPALQLRVLAQMKQPRFVMADTMDLWINIARDDLQKVIREVDLLTVNDGEARLLTGEYNLRNCAAALLDMGPEYVVVKKGEHGAMLFSKAGIALVPAYPVDRVVDPTGAGDTFAGACLGRLSQFRAVDEPAVREALLHGAVAASFTVEDFSNERLRALDTAAIADRLAELKQMARFGA